MIAKRLRERYPQLLDPKLRAFDVTVSNRVRTTQTANSFLKEIKTFYQHDDGECDQIKMVAFNKMEIFQIFSLQRYTMFQIFTPFVKNTC